MMLHKARKKINCCKFVTGHAKPYYGRIISFLVPLCAISVLDFRMSSSNKF